MQSLVSIIIPTYQSCNRLKIALNSVLSQTYGNYEVLIMDDGSTDGTSEMVNSFKDTRIFYNWQTNSGGPAKPRNRGIKLAKGNWIAFLDSDDVWKPDKLKICMKYTNNQIDLIYHDLEIISNKRKIFRRKIARTRKLKKPILIDLLVNNNLICNSSVVVRKDLLDKVGGINENRNLVAAEDYNTWLRIARLTDQFIYLPHTLGYYFIHSDSLSNKNMSIPVKLAVEEFLGILNKQQKLKLEARIRYTSGRFNYLNSNFEKAKKELLFVLKKGSIALKVRSILMIINIFMRLKY
jgi:glycosyltransferase involved in cell wall biosynthesis